MSFRTGIVDQFCLSF